MKRVLESKLKDTNVYWVEFIELKNKKNLYISDNLLALDNMRHNKDSIGFFLANKVDNEFYANESKTTIKSLSYNEFYINNYLLDLKNNINEHSQQYNFLSKTDSIDDRLNNIIVKYNNSVLLFNKKRSVFPNSLIANKLDLKNLKFYSINYGKTNINPKIKTNMEKWVETGNSKYLRIKR